MKRKIKESICNVFAPPCSYYNEKGTQICLSLHNILKKE